jgi:N6-adenosine-specific RNA methylase IME4
MTHFPPPRIPADPSLATYTQSRREFLKPGYFRGLIDRMFPTGRRAELFARGQVEGWDCYGDEF